MLKLFHPSGPRWPTLGGMPSKRNGRASSSSTAALPGREAGLGGTRALVAAHARAGWRRWSESSDPRVSSCSVGATDRRAVTGPERYFLGRRFYQPTYQQVMTCAKRTSVLTLACTRGAHAGEAASGGATCTPLNSSPPHPPGARGGWGGEEAGTVHIPYPPDAAVLLSQQFRTVKYEHFLQKRQGWLLQKR